MNVLLREMRLVSMLICPETNAQSREYRVQDGRDQIKHSKNMDMLTIFFHYLGVVRYALKY